MAVVLLAVVVFAGLAGVGGAHWTNAVFTDTKTDMGNEFSTATLYPPTGLEVTANANAEDLDLAWGDTSSDYATGYKVWRAPTSVSVAGSVLSGILTGTSLAASWTFVAVFVSIGFYAVGAHTFTWSAPRTPTR